MYVDTSVSSSITMRMDAKTPRETFDTIVGLKGLKLLEWDKGLVVYSPNPVPVKTRAKDGSDDFEETIGNYIGAISRQVQAAAKDPGVTDAFAQYYWNLFSALRSKGFTEQQAILVMSQASVPLDFNDK